jgi:hypothetical protein
VATDVGARRLSRRGFISYSTDDGLPANRVASLLETSSGEVCATSLVAYRRELSCFDGKRFRPFCRQRPPSVGRGFARDESFDTLLTLTTA